MRQRPPVAGERRRVRGHGFRPCDRGALGGRDRDGPAWPMAWLTAWPTVRVDGAVEASAAGEGAAEAVGIGPEVGGAVGDGVGAEVGVACGLGRGRAKAALGAEAAGPRSPAARPATKPVPSDVRPHCITVGPISRTAMASEPPSSRSRPCGRRGARAWGRRSSRRTGGLCRRRALGDGPWCGCASGGIIRRPRARSSVDQSIGLRNRVSGVRNPSGRAIVMSRDIGDT